jgi:hypothetical protein
MVRPRSLGRAGRLNRRAERPPVPFDQPHPLSRLPLAALSAVRTIADAASATSAYIQIGASSSETVVARLQTELRRRPACLRPNVLVFG